jgi:hypothetical protein
MGATITVFSDETVQYGTSFTDVSGKRAAAVLQIEEPYPKMEAACSSETS